MLNQKVINNLDFKGEKMKDYLKVQADNLVSVKTGVTEKLAKTIVETNQYEGIGNKTITTAINDAKKGIDGKQTITDENLKTKEKNIVNAINEIFDLVSKKTIYIDTSEVNLSIIDENKKTLKRQILNFKDLTNVSVASDNPEISTAVLESDNIVFTAVSEGESSCTISAENVNSKTIKVIVAGELKIMVDDENPVLNYRPDVDRVLTVLNFDKLQNLTAVNIEHGEGKIRQVFVGTPNPENIKFYMESPKESGTYKSSFELHADNVKENLKINVTWNVEL